MSLRALIGGPDRRPTGLDGERCFICGTRAPWAVWEGAWRPVCRRHFVVMRWDTLSDRERGLPRHPDLKMAYFEYVEETEKGSAREREYLAGVTRGIT